MTERSVVSGKVKMTPSEAFCETMVAQDVKIIFGIVGSAFMDALDIFPAAGIKFQGTAHEQGAGHMADGYSRISGKVGVCIGQNGPGVTNFVTAIAAAYWAHSPVVLITPETGTATMGLGGFQETEQLPLFSKITKFQAHVANRSRIAELTSRCFDRALLEMGPTQINIPRDLFYGDIECEIPKPIRVARGAGDDAALDAAAALLASAKFPVILAGGGVVFSDGVQQCIALAELLQAPVVNSYLHNDSFPASHSLAAGPLGYQGSKAAMRLIAQADVVLALGSRLGPFGTLPQFGIEYWPKTAKIIQIDADARMIGLVKPVAVGIVADAKSSAQALVNRLQKLSIHCLDNKATRLETIAKEKQSWKQELDQWTHEIDAYSVEVSAIQSQLMHPRQVLRALQLALPKHVIVSTDIGNVCSVANSYLAFEEPRSFLAAMAFGNCGYAFPVAIGAKIAAPNRPVVVYVGDGAFGISFNELLTCALDKIGVTVVVFNNQQWGAEKKNQVDFYNRRFVGAELPGHNWAQIATSFGCVGKRITNVKDVGAALQESIEAQTRGVTTVLEMMLNQSLGEPFRRDALSKPVRHLDKYKNYV